MPEDKAGEDAFWVRGMWRDVKVEVLWLLIQGGGQLGTGDRDG